MISLPFIYMKFMNGKDKLNQLTPPMTPKELFIYHSVNSDDNEPTIKFSQIPNSIRNVLIEIWNSKTVKEQEKIIIEILINKQKL